MNFRKQDGNTEENFEGVSSKVAQRIEEQQATSALDIMYGYRLPTEPFYTAYIINMHEGTFLDDDSKKLSSCLDLYCATERSEDQKRFKLQIPFMPYCFIMPSNGSVANDLASHLPKKFKLIAKVERIKKEDLSLRNHLVGLKRTFLKCSFYNNDDLRETVRDLQRIVAKNKQAQSQNTAFKQLISNHLQGNTDISKVDKIHVNDPLDHIADIFEYDMPYHVRVSIDLEIKSGVWYDINITPGEPVQFSKRGDIEVQLEQKVLAYDIETTKLPLKFPDSSIDQIMMISYVVDGQGYLIINREVVSEDIDSFEYECPKNDYTTGFIVFNEVDERALILKFFSHIIEIKPMVIVTYNGDFFDWPFVDARAEFHGFDMYKQIGFKKNMQDNYVSNQCSHMDAFCWVKRDSYLPVGSQGLKAATKAKLRYDPEELDPELMTPYAQEQPQILSKYSVSDAVATYYLYKVYVDPFVFALCTIIPWEPDSVLRKGSGTLCESLLCVQAFRGNIIFPNKQKDPEIKLGGID